MRVMWPPLPPGFGILVRSDRSAANRASGLPIIHPPIECKPLAVDHLAVLHDRHVDAAAALGIDQFDGLRYRVGIFSAAPWWCSMVSKRSPGAGLAGVCPAWLQMCSEFHQGSSQREGPSQFNQ